MHLAQAKARDGCSNDNAFGSEQRDGNPTTNLYYKADVNANHCPHANAFANALAADCANAVVSPTRSRRRAKG